MMRVIGTAGHVDHGKSTLVRRLTGIDPDRLQEEKQRQMTIDLGFAWLTLGETQVGVVDVPGHRDFIENMLAGVGGIDAAVLVIAADEGVMPQTREHLAILDLLGIENGIIALTKIDMVHDAEWLDLIELDIQDVLTQTRLKNAPIVRVSAYTGEGIPELTDALTQLLDSLPQRPDYNQPRLPVDRVFTIAGFGTVVTGTLLGGKLRIGDEIELQPSGQRGRVRGLQSYKQQVDASYPGSRVAVNISGVDKSAVQRGDVLAYPGQIKPSVLVDVYFEHLPDAPRPLKHNSSVKLFSGAAETTATVRLLSHQQLEAGESGWLQLKLDNPMPLSRGDRYILRYPSPAETIGGGLVVRPNAAHRWKRFRPAVLQQLETMLQGSPEERLAQAAESTEPLKRVHLQKSTGFGDAELTQTLHHALNNGLLIELAPDQFMATVTYYALLGKIEAILKDYHAAYPLRLGIPREELRRRIDIKNKVLGLILERQPMFVIEGDLLRLETHQIRFTAAQEALIDTLAPQMNTYTPLSVQEAAAIVGDDVLYALVQLGELVQIQPDVVLSRGIYAQMVAGVLEMIDKSGGVEAKTLRDQFNTSRKYAVGLLEHLDAIGITRRVGDVRVRGSKGMD